MHASSMGEQFFSFEFVLASPSAFVYPQTQLDPALEMNHCTQPECLHLSL